MIDPQAARMVTIPAWVDENGALRFFYGGPLPALAPGATVDLSVPEQSVESSFHLSLLTEQTADTLLPVGAILAAEIRFRHASERDAVADRYAPESVLTTRHSTDAREAAVFIILEEDLRFDLSLGKPAGLTDCRCRIPALPAAARSVNHAYTLISQHFEPHRRSHTGNVFEKVLAWNPKAQNWRRLADLRSGKVRALEENLIRACDPWWYCGVRGAKPDTWAILDAPGNQDATIHLLKQVAVPATKALLEWNTVVVDRVPCRGRDWALEWLNRHKFEHLPEIDYPALTAPQPPYIGSDGKPDPTLDWADRAAYLQRARSYFEARRQGSRQAV